MKGWVRMLDNNTNDLINTFLKVKPHLEFDNLEVDKGYIKENEEIQKLISSSILNSLILSKKIFKRNYMIGKFLEMNFSIKLSQYVLSSRTMICGKVTKEIYSINNSDELIALLNALYSVLKKIKDNKDVFDSDIYEVIMGMEL